MKCDQEGEQMRKRITLILAALAVVTASTAAYFRGNISDSGPGVATATVSRGSVVETVEATGTLEAVTTVAVGTQVSGTIKALHADYNSQVRQGQVIARLDPSLFETQVEQARATVERLEADADAARVRVDDARVKLQRARELSERQLIPATDLETAEVAARQAVAALKGAEAQVAQGRATLRTHEVNLGHATIKAPIDGIVISRNVDVGQTVAASMSAPTVFVLAQDLRQMQVNTSVDESDIGRIRPGQQVEFRVDAYVDDTFTGTVRQVRLEPVVEQNVVSYVTVIDVPNADLKLKPGMTASVTIVVARADETLRVPNAALRFRPAANVSGAPAQQTSALTADGPPAGRGAGVWVLREGALARVQVRPGISDGITTAVASSELEEGVQVVTSEATPAAGTRAPQASGSPLLPQRPAGSRSQAGRTEGGVR
jgi:HlyD family secretion protein